MSNGMAEDLALAIDQVTIALGEQILVSRLSMTVAPGETAAVMGPSGSGKSTLLALIAGFLDPNFKASGDIRIGGRSILSLRSEQRSVGLVFQDDLLFPHMNVAENLGFGLKKRQGERWPERSARIEEALKAADLAGYGNRRPDTLSGGQRARVSLLRSLLAEPAVLLLDEPFSKLDSALRGAFRGFVFDQIAARRIPAVMVTHDKSDIAGANGPVVDLSNSRAVLS